MLLFVVAVWQAVELAFSVLLFSVQIYVVLSILVSLQVFFERIARILSTFGIDKKNDNFLVILFIHLFIV